MNAKFIKLGLITTLVTSLSYADELKIDPFIGVEYGYSKSDYKYKGNTLYLANNADISSTSRTIKIGAFIENDHRVYVNGEDNLYIGANYDYIYHNENNLKLLAGGGIWYANVDNDSRSSTKGIALNVSLGILYSLHSHVDLELGYRYAIITPDTKASGYTIETSNTHNIFAGINYNF